MLKKKTFFVVYIIIILKAGSPHLHANRYKYEHYLINNIVNIDYF